MLLHLWTKGSRWALKEKVLTTWSQESTIQQQSLFGCCSGAPCRTDLCLQLPFTEKEHTRDPPRSSHLCQSFTHRLQIKWESRGLHHGAAVQDVTAEENSFFLSASHLSVLISTIEKGESLSSDLLLYSWKSGSGKIHQLMLDLSRRKRERTGARLGGLEWRIFPTSRWQWLHLRGLEMLRNKPVEIREGFNIQRRQIMSCIYHLYQVLP